MYVCMYVCMLHTFVHSVDNNRGASFDMEPQAGAGGCEGDIL